MKKNLGITKLLLPVIVCAALCACGELEFEEGVQISIESSSVYEDYEIRSAIDVCIDYFNENFVGCTLTDISYEEELCLRKKDYWAAQYEAADAIVLTSTFDVDENGGDGSLNPNQTYANWQWTLTRSDSDEEWTLQTCGY